MVLYYVLEGFCCVVVFGVFFGFEGFCDCDLDVIDMGGVLKWFE